MEDVCGNNYTQQISVTSDSFPPIVKVGFFCFGNSASLQAVASPYFSYIWQHPDGSQTTGNSIVFSPFTPADTGTYHILKIVNINGCNDTLETYYHLQSGDSIRQNFTLCYGDSIIIGTNTYTQSGVYINPFTTINGCDSIIVTTLDIMPLPADTLQVTICKGDSVAVGNHVYFQSGIYTDTIVAQTPCLIRRTTKVTVDFFETNESYQICYGDTLSIGAFIHFEEGLYHDTLKTYLGCDSVINVQLQFYPKPSYPLIIAADSINVNDSIFLSAIAPNAVSYQWHGQAAFSNVDSSASFAVLINSGWIYVSITDLYGCTYSDSTFIRVVSNEICNVDFWNHLPNVFTPNNDGLNDSFEFAEHEQEVMHLSVCNRWGKMVFDSGYAKKWDGRDNYNIKCPSGVYFYIINYFDCMESKQKIISGSINLIR